MVVVQLYITTDKNNLTNKESETILSEINQRSTITEQDQSTFWPEQTSIVRKSQVIIEKAHKTKANNKKFKERAMEEAA